MNTTELDFLMDLEVTRLALEEAGVHYKIERVLVNPDIWSEIIIDRLKLGLAVPNFTVEVIPSNLTKKWEFILTQ